ncbi:hypothetical protein EVAR_75416_1 [Eumeta japonica]|uniref:Uncharacterized protein n=1 Tax=Eumeta variegata TaxID=151549 RepID=A0A4C1TL96_EUMVA|nr:hypothetical protein EVAR_75416_1 [Eumeta japonica]
MSNFLEDIPLKTCGCPGERELLALTVTPGPAYWMSVTAVPNRMSKPSASATGTHEYPLRTLSAHNFVRVGKECVPLSSLLDQSCCQFQSRSRFDSNSGNVLESVAHCDSGHTIDYSPTPALNFDLDSDSRLCSLSRFQFRYRYS